MKLSFAGTSSAPSSPAKAQSGSIAAAVILFACLWLQLINHLRSEWSFNPQYSYGWSVPFLALYLIWRRWLNRPAPAPARARGRAIILILFCAFLFLPIRFLGEANPDWRLLSWALAAAAVAMALSLIFLAGGMSSVRHFAFPFIFLLVAVPWPALAEQFVTQGLMRAVTAINVLFLNLAGIPALQQGNAIEVGTGLIGIEEACSGVRSLQATLMISLFLGELYSFSVARRVVLVIAGALLAFLCNLIRTAILVWIGAHHGAAALHAWHDPAGFSILLVCLFGLWLVSLLMRRDPPVEVPVAPDGNASWRISFALLISVALWLLLAEGAVQLWYHGHQSQVTGSRWDVRWPTSENAYQTVPIAPEAEGLLRYNEGGGATWKSADGRQWLMYFFRWSPGRTAALFVKTHRPDVCLPASGMTLVSDSGLRLMTVHGLNLPVRSYRFEHHGGPLHVFYCYWDARSSYEDAKTAVAEDWTPQGRLRAALSGRRELGAQMLEIAVWGYEDDNEAGAALYERLAQLVVKRS
jgi:exosortase